VREPCPYSYLSQYDVAQSVEVRGELGFHVYLKLSIYASEVASAKHAKQCKVCKLLILRRLEPRTFNTEA